MYEQGSLKVVRHGSEPYWQTVRLRQAILRTPLGLTFTPEELAAEEDSFHLTHWQDGRLVGCLVLNPLDDKVIRMRQVAVREDCRGHGIGRALIQFSESFAVQRGCEEMTLHARQTAVGFYEKLGYVTQGECFVEVGIPHVTMTKLFAAQREDGPGAA